MLLDFLYVRSALLKHNPANQKGVEGGTRLCQYQKAVHHCRSFRKDKKENRTRENKKKVSQKINHTSTSPPISNPDTAVTNSTTKRPKTKGKGSFNGTATSSQAKLPYLPRTGSPKVQVPTADLADTHYSTPTQGYTSVEV
jgi:uncharacterized surface anchored protein